MQYRLIMVKQLRKIENYLLNKHLVKSNQSVFEKYGQVRGDFTVEEKGDKHRLINVFSTSAYRKEAERILRKQQEFNNQITDEFIENYLKNSYREKKIFIMDQEMKNLGQIMGYIQLRKILR